MNCLECKRPMVAEVDITGGCCGHFGEDDRCYCDSPDVHIYFRCTNRKCKSKIVKPKGLRDSGGIARYFTEHYVIKESETAP